MKKISMFKQFTGSSFEAEGTCSITAQPIVGDEYFYLFMLYVPKIFPLSPPITLHLGLFMIESTPLIFMQAFISIFYTI